MRFYKEELDEDGDLAIRDPEDGTMYCYWRDGEKHRSNFCRYEIDNMPMPALYEFLINNAHILLTPEEFADIKGEVTSDPVPF